MIKCAVIPVAGLGNRMLPLSKCMSKEMLPIFSRSYTGMVLKPFLQIILEQMIAYGIHNVCMIVNESKTSILDYFRVDDWTHDSLFQKFNTRSLTYTISDGLGV